MLDFTLNRQQYSELAGLAYHHSDLFYRLEHCPNLPEGERIRDRQNVEQHFNALDALGVPFWVQNVVLLWSENWRNYAAGHMQEFLKTKNIFIA